jgi:hypothetical protein
MYNGHVFLCSNTSLEECLKQKQLSCPREKHVDQDIRINSVVFLFNKDTDTLVGPFNAAGSAEIDLEPGAWTEEINTQSLSGNIMVEWEELHEMKDAQLKFPFLKNEKTCKLSELQTQNLLNALKQAPLSHKK